MIEPSTLKLAKLAVLLIPLALAACGGRSSEPQAAAPQIQQPAPPSGLQPEACQVQEVKQIAGPSGGSLDWSPVDNNLLLIAGSDENGIKQVYTIQPDGSNKVCITCVQASGGPPVEVHKGVAHWAPDGKTIFLQVEQENHGGKRRLAEPGSGRNNDLWVTTADATQWWRLTDYAANREGGVLFPVPSHGGTQLAWAERYAGPDKPVATLIQLMLNRPTEDLWGKWRLNIANIVDDANGPRLENTQTFTPGDATFYEMQVWSLDDGKIYFAANINRDTPYTLDIWVMDVNSQELTPITNTDDEWEEHLSISPSGNKLALMSSECCEWNPDKLGTLRAELYLTDTDGSNKVQLTHFNTPGYPESSEQSVVSKMVWRPDGTHLAFQRILMAQATLETAPPTDLWMLTFAGACGTL